MPHRVIIGMGFDLLFYRESYKVGAKENLASDHHKNFPSP